MKAIGKNLIVNVEKQGVAKTKGGLLLSRKTKRRHLGIQLKVSVVSMLEMML